MKVVIKKNNLIGILALMSWGAVIIYSLSGTITTRYLMYATIILMGVLVTVFSQKYASKGILSMHPGIFVYLIIVEVITFITQALNGSINSGSVIQPIFLFVVFTMGYRIRETDERLSKNMMYALFATFLFAAIVGVQEFFNHSNIFFPDYGRNTWQAYRVSSLFRHPLMYSTMMSIGFWISIYLIKNRVLKIVSIGLFSFGIFASLSRSSWLAWLIGLIIVLVSELKSKLTKKKLLGTIGAIAFVAIFFQTKYGANMTNVVIARFSNILKDVSLTQRIGTINYIFNYINDNFNLLMLLLGHGEDSAAHLMLDTVIYIEKFSTTDNQYLLIFYNYGIVALLVIIKLIIDVIRLIFLKYSRLTDLTKCLCATMITLAVTAFFYEITEAKVCGWVMVLLMGFMTYDIDERRGRGEF